MQYNLHRLADGPLVVDLQSDLVDIGTRVVAPVLQGSRARLPMPTLEPTVKIDGVAHVILVTEMTALPTRLLGPAIGTLGTDDYAIRRAVDMVFTGI